MRDVLAHLSKLMEEEEYEELEADQDSQLSPKQEGYHNQMKSKPKILYQSSLSQRQNIDYFPHSRTPSLSPMETKRAPAGASSFFPSESLERKTQHSSVQSIGSISSKVAPSEEDYYLEKIQTIATKNSDSQDNPKGINDSKGVLQNLTIDQNVKNGIESKVAQRFNTKKTNQVTATTSYQSKNNILNKKSQQEEPKQEQMYTSVTLNPQSQRIINKKMQSGSYQPIQQRWSACLQARTEKVEEARILKEEREREKELREATFKPILTANSTKHHIIHRTQQDLLNHLNEWNEKKMSKLRDQQIKENQREINGLTFQPHINQHSIQLLKKQQLKDEDVVHRLYTRRKQEIDHTTQKTSKISSNNNNNNAKQVGVTKINTNRQKQNEKGQNCLTPSTVTIKQPIHKAYRSITPNGISSIQDESKRQGRFTVLEEERLKGYSVEKLGLQVEMGGSRENSKECENNRNQAYSEDFKISRMHPQKERRNQHQLIEQSQHKSQERNNQYSLEKIPKQKIASREIQQQFHQQQLPEVRSTEENEKISQRQQQLEKQHYFQESIEQQDDLEEEGELEYKNNYEDDIVNDNYNEDGYNQTEQDEDEHIQNDIVNNNSVENIHQTEQKDPSDEFNRKLQSLLDLIQTAQSNNNKHKTNVQS